VVLFLSILLYGSETLRSLEDLFERLRHFHHRCARAMCRITIAKKIAAIFHLPTFKAPCYEALRHLLQSSNFLMDRPCHPDAINPSPMKNLELFGLQSSTSAVPANILGPNSEKFTSQ
jgi:hypothetical protein